MPPSNQQVSEPALILATSLDTTVEESAPAARVLLVEDNIDDERLTLRALGKTPQKPEIVVARDGERAIDLIREWDSAGAGHEQLPVLVLLDLRLPKLNGFEVLEVIRNSAALRDVTVVVLTSSDEQMDIERAWALGANDYVKKPVDYEGYIAALGSVANLWLPKPDPNQASG